MWVHVVLGQAGLFHEIHILLLARNRFVRRRARSDWHYPERWVSSAGRIPGSERLCAGSGRAPHVGAEAWAQESAIFPRGPSAVLPLAWTQRGLVDMRIV